MTRRVLLRCDSTGDLYPVTAPSLIPHVFLVSQHTWHQRLGHPRCEVLHHLVSNNFISCNKEKPPMLCHACQLGKHVRLWFVSSNTVVTSRFDIIHSDVWTLPIPSLSGFKYYCDHGGEFDIRNLHKLFADNGIQFCFSCPQTSQQNGKSERMVRTINNLIRTLLFQANLPPTFWVEALNVATQLLNFLPSNIINNKIPYTRLFGTNPDYSLLRTFGCLCYPHFQTNHKLEPRVTPSIYLGQASNHRGYRCLKIIISRHVTFDETVFPFGSTQPALPPTYTFLDNIPDLIPLAIPTSPVVQLPPEPITLIHNTPIQHHPNEAQLPTTPQQLSPAQVQTPGNEAHSPPPSASAVQQQTPTPTPSPVTQNKHVAQSPIIISDLPVNPNPVSVHPMVTRFRVGTNRPTQRLNFHVSSVSPLPKSYRDVFSDPNWQNAMRDEYHYLADGTLSRYKARLVANGSTQLEGIDVDETFSLVVKPGTIRTVLNLSASRHWPIHQLDVNNAFLHGDLSETVYMHQPLGFRDSVHPDYVCLLQRQGTDTAYLLLYVDDIVLIASSEGLLQQIISSLHQEFAMTDLGPLNYFLGIYVTCDSSSLFLSQKKYANTLLRFLDSAHMVIGSLQYLTFTRPDISYAVQQVCLYMHDPREPHFSALKRILRYVRGTLDYGLQLFSSSTTDLVAYSDADWAGCPTTWRLTLGYCVFLGNNLLSWSSKRQPTLSRSRAKAEYRGVANVVAETCWLRNLLRELHTPLTSATLVYCDNVSAVYLFCNPVQHQRTKHIEIDIHFVRDLVVAGQVRVLHVPSRYQFADIFTKGLPSALFEVFRSSLSVQCPPALTAGEC
ncbi:ribonuclease H-like domain-containing protein [Tanacetum coccineum]